MEQLKIQLDAIINGQAEILKGHKEMQAFQCQVNQELRDVKQNVVDLTEKVDQLLVRIDALEKPPLQNNQNQRLLMSSSSQTSFLDLPPEMVEMVFQNFTSSQDVENCSIALAGTRHKEFVTHKFLKLQLKNFATLPSLNVSLKNEGWFEECQDTKLILRLFKEYKPILPSMYHFFQNSSWEICVNFQKIFQTHNKYLFPL